MPSHSTECLTTTEMEEYEREAGEYSYLGSTGSESEDETKKMLFRDESVQEEDGGGNVGEESGDSVGEGEPGSGYSISSDEGSSADDDEDSKLRALLQQIWRPYAGYSSGGEDIGYDPRSQRRKKQQTNFASPHHTGKSTGTPENGSKTSDNLGQINGNIRNESITIHEDGESGVMATKSTFFGRDTSGNGIIVLEAGSDENAKPRETAEDYSKGYTLGNHILGFGSTDGQWRIKPEVMKFLVH